MTPMPQPFPEAPQPQEATRRLEGVKAKGEWIWPLAAGILIMAVTCIPYVLGYLHAGSGWSFSGFIFATDDGNSYLATMQRGALGEWLWRTAYTTYPQNGTLIFLFYLLTGKLFASPASHTGLVLAYHSFRCLAGVLAILATYDFLALFIHDVHTRRLATLLAALGGGLGWIILIVGKTALLGSLPIEFYSPEAFGFLSLFEIPHLALARAFLLWGLRSYLLARQETGRAWVWGSLRTGLFWILTFLAQPLTGMIAGAVAALHIGVLTLWNLRSQANTLKPLPLRQKLGIFFAQPEYRAYLLRFVIAGCMAAPLAIYNALIFYIDPFSKYWSQQSSIPSPNPLLYVLAYGLILPFAIAGAITLLRQDFIKGSFLVFWIPVFLAAIYIPFSFQRRLVEGLWVAWVALAGIALEAAQKCPSPATQWIKKARPALLLSCIAPLLLFSGSLQTVSTPAQPLFQPADEVAAFDYFIGQARPNAVVLSAYDSGNLLPTYAPVIVVLGQSTQTVPYQTLRAQVEAFYQSSTSDADRQALLSTQHVTYVFWGKDEQALGDWNPQAAAYLEPVFHQGSYWIFKVK